MIKFENVEVVGWEAAIRGMRNPMNSWEKSDSLFIEDGEYHNIYGDSGPYYDSEKAPYEVQPIDGVLIGMYDLDLMRRLGNAGTDHRKFMRMITVYVDITAPIYWWKEFDTYKVGTVANSCSTMHKITDKEFTLDDFSCEHLFTRYGDPSMNLNYSDKFTLDVLRDLIRVLNHFRYWYKETNDKKYWWQMIQLLPSSYNQKRTVMLNYEVLANIYKSRKNHKLDEWSKHDGINRPLAKITNISECDGDVKFEGFKYFGFCDWIETLPYSELITGESLRDIPICNEIIEEAKKRVKAEEN